MASASSMPWATAASRSGSTRLTNPIASASAAVKSLPVYTSSATWPGLTSRGNRCSVPTSATMASRVSRTEKTVSAAATRMSHAVIRSTPAPMHQPWVTAITGCGQSATAVKVRCIRFTIAWVPRRSATLDPPPPRVGPKAARSSPTVKAGPLAAMTIALVSGSDPAASTAAGNSSQNAGAIALRRSGSSSQTTETCPRRSTLTTPMAGNLAAGEGDPTVVVSKELLQEPYWRPGHDARTAESSSGVSMLRQERPSSPHRRHVAGAISVVATWSRRRCSDGLGSDATRRSSAG